MLKGFKNFLMQGDLIIIAVGLVVALAFSTLIKAFTDNVITPLINAAGGGGAGAKGSAGPSTDRESTWARSSPRSSTS
jgi:large conductance mechanosensitive channel